MRSGAPQAGFTECLNSIEQGKVAMWYDATSAAGSLGGAGLPGRRARSATRRRRSRRPSPRAGCTPGRGRIQKASKKQDDAWKFISWASSKQYEELVGQQLGWATVPAGKRASTYANPDYLKAAGAFAAADQDRDRDAPTRTTRACSRGRTIGIQFVDIPEFPDLGTKVSQDISSAIAGKESVDAGAEQGPAAGRDSRQEVQVARPARGPGGRCAGPRPDGDRCCRQRPHEASPTREKDGAR